MRTLPLSEAKAKLSELVNEVSERDERVVITKNGRPAAVLVSHDRVESIEETLEILRDPRFVKEILEASARTARGETVPYEEVFGEKPPRRRRSAQRTR